jgi:hypothetical protein
MAHDQDEKNAQFFSDAFQNIGCEHIRLMAELMAGITVHMHDFGESVLNGQPRIESEVREIGINEDGLKTGVLVFCVTAPDVRLLRTIRETIFDIIYQIITKEYGEAQNIH